MSKFIKGIEAGLAIASHAATLPTENPVSLEATIKAQRDFFAGNTATKTRTYTYGINEYDAAAAAFAGQYPDMQTEIAANNRLVDAIIQDDSIDGYERAARIGRELLAETKLFVEELQS